jgi:hypothetical protein
MDLDAFHAVHNPAGYSVLPRQAINEGTKPNSLHYAAHANEDCGVHKLLLDGAAPTFPSNLHNLVVLNQDRYRSNIARKSVHAFPRGTIAFDVMLDKFAPAPLQPLAHLLRIRAG